MLAHDQLTVRETARETFLAALAYARDPDAMHEATRGGGPGGGLGASAVATVVATAVATAPAATVEGRGTAAARQATGGATADAWTPSCVAFAELMDRLATGHSAVVPPFDVSAPHAPLLRASSAPSSLVVAAPAPASPLTPPPPPSNDGSPSPQQPHSQSPPQSESRLRASLPSHLRTSLRINCTLTEGIGAVAAPGGTPSGHAVAAGGVAGKAVAPLPPLLSDFEAEGLLSLGVALLPHLPARFLVRNWPLCWGVLDRYLAHQASTVRQVSCLLACVGMAVRAARAFEAGGRLHRE